MSIEHSISGEDFDSSEEEIQTWEELIQEGVSLAIENFALFYYPAEDSKNQIPTPLNLSPQVLTQGMDDRSFVFLEPDEREIIKREIYGQLGVDRENPEFVDEYPVVSSRPDDADLDPRWSGQGLVRIVRTEKEDEEIFLHEITYTDERVDFFLAEKDYRFDQES